MGFVTFQLVFNPIRYIYSLLVITKLVNAVQFHAERYAVSRQGSWSLVHLLITLEVEHAYQILAAFVLNFRNCIQ